MISLSKMILQINIQEGHPFKIKVGPHNFLLSNLPRLNNIHIPNHLLKLILTINIWLIKNLKIYIISEF